MATFRRDRIEGSETDRGHALGGEDMLRIDVAGGPCKPKILPGLGPWSRLPSSTGAFFVYFHLRHRPAEDDPPPGQLGLHQLHHTQGLCETRAG